MSHLNSRSLEDDCENYTFRKFFIIYYWLFNHWWRSLLCQYHCVAHMWKIRVQSLVSFGPRIFYSSFSMSWRVSMSHWFLIANNSRPFPLVMGISISSNKLNRFFFLFLNTIFGLKKKCFFDVNYLPINLLRFSMYCLMIITVCVWYIC